MSENYIFNDSATVIFLKNEDSIIAKNENAYIKVKLLKSEKKELLEAYKLNNKIRLNESLSNNYKKLIENNILIKFKKNKYLNTKYERTNQYFQDLYKKDIIKILNSKRILIIGVGGIGTEVIKHLLMIGIQDYILVDFDKIEINNLNRQFIFNVNELNRLKTEVAKEYILKNEINANVKCYNKKIASVDDICEILNIEKKIDIIVCAADFPMYAIRKHVVESSIKYNIPCIFGGVGIKEGTVGPLFDNIEKLKEYNVFLDNMLDKIELIKPCAGSVGITNTIISCYMANAIYKYLINSKETIKCLNKEFVVNFS